MAIITIFILGFVNPNPQKTEKKLSLLIFNTDYKNDTTLKGALDYGDSLKSVLTDIGFEVILYKNIGSRAGLIRVIDSVHTISNSENYKYTLFYYFGHGINLNSNHYLVPTDFNVEQLSNEVIINNFYNINGLLRENHQIEKSCNIFVIDACRNGVNPNISPPSLGIKSADGAGTIIFYSTRDKKKAYQPYFTPTFIKCFREMKQEEELIDVFKKIQQNVKNMSDGNQKPQIDPDYSEKIFLKH
jgi:hypothetical protein